MEALVVGTLVDGVTGMGTMGVGLIEIEVVRIIVGEGEVTRVTGQADIGCIVDDEGQDTVEVVVDGVGVYEMEVVDGPAASTIVTDTVDILFDSRVVVLIIVAAGCVTSIVFVG